MAKTAVLFAAICISVQAKAQTFTSFIFKAADIEWESDLPGVIDNENQTITLTTQQWIENITALPATFAINGNYAVTVAGVEQVSEVTPNDFRHDVIYTVGGVDYTVILESPQASGLPVIRIDTEGGAEIVSKDDYLKMNFAMDDPDNDANAVEKTGMKDEIKGRGNSTWNGDGDTYWPPDKKPYRIKFDKKTSLFGLPAAKSWVLLANWFDPTLMKNTFAFELGDRLGLPFNHSYNHVELYLNGTYRGNYLFTEQNQAGEGRVAIDEDDGWLVEVDFHYDEEPKFKTDAYELPVMVKSPETEPLDMTNEDYVRVKTELDELCALMAADDFPENGYRDLIDLEAMVKYFMITTVTGVGDFVNPGSVYLYRDKNGKIAGGPSWDFDVNFGFSWQSVPVYEIDDASATWHWFPGVSRGNLFFKRFSDDPMFMVKWKEIWNNQYSDIASMMQFIDEMANKIRKSAKENYKVSWLNYPVDFDQWINELKSYLAARLEYLDGYYKIDIPQGLTATYGQTLAGVALPSGWEWMDATLQAGTLGTQTYKARYGDVTNLNVPVTVSTVPPVNTGLPLVYIDTEGGAEILDKENYVSIVSFSLTDPENHANNVSRNNAKDGIRGRGNDSWENPNALKKSYRVKFDTKEGLLGMGSSKSWILHAQYRDPTLLFNAIAFELGNRFRMPYNHSTRFVELYMNGEYRGNYMVTEHNQTGEGRVDIDEDEGWFVEMDGQYDEEPKFRTSSYSLPVMIKTPEVEPLNMSNQAYDFVRKDLNRLNDSVASAHFPENGYRDLIDMNTFVDFLMITEIVDNKDFQWPASTYLYKDKGGAISMGPLWDFDCGYGYGYNYEYFSEPGSRAPMHEFFRKFYDDPVFLVKYKERWNEKYADIASINEFIDTTADKIETSANQNFKTWWYRVISPWWITRHGAEANNFRQQVENTKHYLDAHVAYLNTELNKVEVLPASKSFGTYRLGDEVAAQTFTLVAYGDIADLQATLQKGESSDFGIGTPVNTATGNGGYLITITVKPQMQSAAMHSDALVLSGTNQGKPFSLEVPLAVTAVGELPKPSMKAWAANGLLHITGLATGETLSIYSTTGTLIYRTVATSDSADIPLTVYGIYIVQSGKETLKVAYSH
jgi:hypothetical protein